MNAIELMALQGSSEAPFNHRDYTIWLHNQIILKIRYEIQQMAKHRKDPSEIPTILNLSCLKIIYK